jgi:hypothetical protein
LPGVRFDPSVRTVADVGSVMSGRSTPAAATVAGIIYLFGGAFDDYSGRTVTPYDATLSFDPDTLVMAQLAPAGQAPGPRVFSAGTADDEHGDLYVFGGSTYNHDFSDLVAFGELYRYNAASNEWELAADASRGPGPRIRPNMWYFDGGIYVFGGLDGTIQNHSDLWRFDTTEQSWMQLAGDSETLGGRYEAVSSNTSHHGLVFAVGGETIRSDFTAAYTPGTVEINLATGTVGQLDVPLEHDIAMGMRHMAAAAIVDGTFYVYGGDDPSDKRLGCGSPHGESPTGALWIFDIEQRTWRLSSTQGPSLKRTVASVASGRMYVFAGWDFECVDGVGRGQLWNTKVVEIDPIDPIGASTP